MTIPPNRTATGGRATPTTDLRQCIDHDDRGLTLRGLRLVWECNR